MSQVSGESSEREVHPAVPDAAPPATAPRRLPERVRAAKRHQLSIWFGGALAVLSTPDLAIFALDLPVDASGWIENSLSLGMFAVGVVLLSRGLWGRANRRRIYRTGKSAVATIDLAKTLVNAQEDGSTRQSYVIKWDFEVDDHTVRGRRESKDERVTELQTGDLIWVLYDPEDPENNVEWPPL